MKKIATSFLAALILGVFTLSACGGGGGGGDKCSKAVDKAMDMAMDMAKGMMEAMGEEGKAKMDEAKAEMAKQKPEAVKQCNEALKKDKNLEKALDCIIGASDLEAMSKCEGADALMGGGM